MVVVAVAGGTGGVGAAIVEALVSQGKHEVKILSRKTDPVKEAELGASIVAADYTSVTSLVNVLEQHNVHTLISALSMMPSEGGLVEPNLINAADLSKSTKRMVSSDWGLDHIKGDEDKLPTVAPKFAAWDSLKATRDLEWTVFRNGYFMDYLGIPRVKSHLAPMFMVLDIANETAAIPGKGDAELTLTHTSDVGKFVAASLDLSSWDKVSYVIGDKRTWSELLKLAEDAKGSKFEVVYDDLDKLQRGEATELPSHAALHKFLPKHQLQVFIANFGLWSVQGRFNLDARTALNKRLPDLKTISAAEVINQGWRA